MSPSNNKDSENTGSNGGKKSAGTGARGRGSRRTPPSHFNPGLVQGLIAGADDVAGRSFIGGGGPVSTSPVETPPSADPTPPSTPSPADTQQATPAVAASPEPAPSLPAQATNEHSTDDTPVATSQAAPGGTPVEEPQSDEPAPARKAAHTVESDVEEIGDGPSHGPEHVAEPPPADPSKSPAERGRSEDEPAKTEGTAPEQVDHASTQVEESASDVASVADGKSTKGGRRRQNAAHSALLDSFKDARLNSKLWQGWGFRIYPDTLAALKQRMNADRRSTGLKLAIGHYVDAALRSAPEDVDAMIKIADAYDDERVFDNETTRPSTYRVGVTAYGIASNLKVTMDEVDASRRGAAFVSAALQKLLDGLEAGGALALPPRGSR